MWKIGNVLIKNKIVLAPMAGISNPAYMKILEEMNVGLVFTELISSEAIIRDNQKTLDMLKGIDDINIPVGVQIFGSNADVLALAAKKLTKLYKFDLIDINMGCPVPKVSLKSNSGSALLKDPERVREIVKKVSESVDIPVTVKIRSGWDSSSINALEIAKIVEEAGAKAISIHPRTRKQGYTGKADWNIIKEVKENVFIPVIGNGDIKSKEDVSKMLNETNCDAVMIGRACLGNPWLIKECVLNKKIDVTLNDKIEMIKKHLNYLLKYKNERLALLEIRTHISWYLKGIKSANALKQAIYKTNSIEELNKLLDEFVRDNNV